MFTRKEVEQVRQLCIDSFGEQAIRGAPKPPTRDELVRREVEEIVAAEPWDRCLRIEMNGRLLCSPATDPVTRQWSKEVLEALLVALETMDAQQKMRPLYEADTGRIIGYWINGNYVRIG